MSTDTPPASPAVNAVINSLPIETLQSERAAMAKAKMDTSAFDSAIAAKGSQVADANVVRDHAAHGVAQGQAQPRDFSGVDYSKLGDLGPERLAAVKAGASTWAARLGFSPAAGQAVLDRIVAVGAELQKMTEPERDEWLQRQEAVTRNVSRGEEGAKKLQAQIEKVLQRAADSDISKNFLKSLVGHDASLRRMIANHGEALDLIAKKYGKK